VTYRTSVIEHLLSALDVEAALRAGGLEDAAVTAVRERLVERA